MNNKAIFIGTTFVLVHIAVVAPFVPITGIVPVALGALSITSMAFSLILAARWRVVDRITGGPDKSYAMHRWLGFFALGGALGHWAIASSAGAGLLPFLSESGEAAGTLAAMGLLVMTAAAMVRAIPYHVWKASHMLMGPIFLLATFHTFFVGSPLPVGTLPWTALALVSAGGVVAWGQTLLRKAAPSRLVTVESTKRFEGGVDLILTSDTNLPKFRPGQFATIAYNAARAEAHPFTIAGGDATSRRFVIRSAGNWTDHFVETVRAGDQLRLGRGVGRFLPQTTANRSEQLWVAGGVGITPFLAALERMTPDDGARVTLVYCVRSRASSGVLADVENHARRLPQVNLIVVSSRKEATLSQSRLISIIRGLDARAEVFLCGPDGLKELVSDAWTTVGMTGRVHSERFDFRGAFGLTDLKNISKSVLDAVLEKGKLHAPSRP